MGIIKSISARNFKCFRSELSVLLGQATYLIGPNNSGKTSLLAALQCFFDSGAYSPELLNNTERAGRREGSNRSEITVTFDLNLVTGRARKKAIVEKYGSDLVVRKTFTWREISGSTDVTYSVNGGAERTLDQLDREVQGLLGAITVSYIHPQEGKDLLQKAQEKFKQRLFQNWGRHPSVAASLRAAQDQWDELRRKANAYLSDALTARLQDVWPGSATRVALPEKIEDIVAISDFTFRSSPSLPEVTLTSHGTGAQSAILYQTHYMLDSDRTLHRGMYFPVWLLEEPESFLHADIAFQLARLLSSEDWLGNIQMVISTHSPIILAGSRQSLGKSRWVVFRDHAVTLEKSGEAVTDADIGSVGEMMGDANFDVYFNAATPGALVFLEDTREETRRSVEQLGIAVTKQLGGISQVKKYLAVLQSFGPSLRSNAYFIVDADSGAAGIADVLARATEIEASAGWRKLKVAERVFLILLPEESAAEDLFAEWEDLLEEVLDDLYDAPLTLKAKVPASLSRAVGRLRRENPATREEARSVIRAEQDVKDMFWGRVASASYSIAEPHAAALRRLVEPA